MHDDIITLSSPKPIDKERVGGKGWGLLQLSQLNLPLPPGFIITTTFFAHTATRPTEQAQHILDAYRQLGAQLHTPEPAVAVRSSASSEDGQQHSFAGAFDTFLRVQGEKQLLEKVNLCRESLYSERANIYRQEMPEDAAAVPQMAVIVQAMIPAESSGVLMTLNPTSGDRSKIVIEASWGLGQLLVDGSINPDRFLIDKITNERIAETIATKTKMLQANQASPAGTTITNVPEHLQNEPSLTHQEVDGLCKYGRLLENHFGLPQDIEFAIFQGEIFLLQVRPETIWAQKQTPAYGLSPNPVEQIVGTLTTFGKKSV